jgi:hypothetical protein
MLDIAMAAALQRRPTDADLEDLWRVFHTGWVRAHEELLDAERHAREAPGGPSGVDLALHRMLRQHEAQQREMLALFERTLREFRSRTAAYRRRYL